MTSPATSAKPKDNTITVYYPRPQADSPSKSFHGSQLLIDSYDYIQIIMQCYLLSLNSTSYAFGSFVGAAKPLVEKYCFNITPQKLNSDANKSALSEAMIMDQDLIDHDAKEPDPRKHKADKITSNFSAYLVHCGFLLATNTALSSLSAPLGNIMTAALAGKYSNDLTQRLVRWLSAPVAKKSPHVK